MNRVLYISYDGLTDPIGRSQVLPYVTGLARAGWDLSVISFEKPERDAAARDRVRGLLEASGARWLPMRYHKRPTVPATAFDIGTGLARALGHRLGGPLALVHVRSYVAASMAYPLKRPLDVPFLFDMRGFWADERVEGGLWPDGALYRTAKYVEERLFNAADHVVSLTEAGKRELERWPSVGGRALPVSVIPTCVDLEQFGWAAAVDRPSRLTIGYLGSLGTRYLIDETVAFFAALQSLVPDARLRVVTPHATEPLDQALARHAVPRAAVEVLAVPYEKVPEELTQMHATVSFIKPGFASLASCPTKFGESLAAGCPVVVNPGIGDCAEIVTREGVGVVSALQPADHPAEARKLIALLEGRAAMRARCLEVARARFSLEGAIAEYGRIYERLATITASCRVRARANEGEGQTVREPPSIDTGSRNVQQR